MLPSILRKKTTDFISVMVNEEDLKVAHVKVNYNVYEVVNIAKRDIRGISQEELPKTIKSTISDFVIKNAQVIYVVPSNFVTTKNIEIPSVDPAEIKSIINLQAGRHTPYSREEIIIDYLNNGIFQRNYSKVLLIIVNRNIMIKQLNILEQAGLKVKKVLFVPEAIGNFYSKVLDKDTLASPVGIIDIGNHFSDFTVAYNQTVIACRSIPVGMIHLASEGQAGQERLVSELKKSIEGYQSEEVEKLPSTYILTSDHVRLKDLQPVLKNVLQVNVKIMPFIDNLKVGQSVRKVLSDMGDESFLDVIAPVVVIDRIKVDLLPEEVKLQRSIEEQGREVLKSAILAVIIFVLICVGFLIKIYFKSSFLSRLKNDYQQTAQEAEILGRISEKTSIVKDRLNNRLVGLEVMSELYRLIPEEIYLNNVILDENGTITIQGTSESMSRVFSLVGALEESGLFKSVKTNSTTAKKERGKDVAAFELTFKLESAKDDLTTADTKEPAKD